MSRETGRGPPMYEMPNDSRSVDARKLTNSGQHRTVRAMNGSDRHSQGMVFKWASYDRGVTQTSGQVPTVAEEQIRLDRPHTRVVPYRGHRITPSSGSHISDQRRTGAVARMYYQRQAHSTPARGHFTHRVWPASIQKGCITKASVPTGIRPLASRLNEGYKEHARGSVER